MGIPLRVAGYLVVALAITAFVAGSDKDNKLDVPLAIAMRVIWVVTVPPLIGAAFWACLKSGRKLQ